MILAVFIHQATFKIFCYFHFCKLENTFIKENYFTKKIQDEGKDKFPLGRQQHKLDIITTRKMKQRANHMYYNYAVCTVNHNTTDKVLLL